jgi:hypothetical protein
MKRLITLLLLAVLLVACGATTALPPAPTVAVTPMVTATPTHAPTPTDTPITQAPAPVPTTTPRPAAPTPTATPKPPSSVPFIVLSVDLAVSPATRDGIACGTSTTFTYTATFHVAGGSPGGMVQFNYTTTNGRQISMGTLNFMSGATVEAFTFTATGDVAADNTFPGSAGVFVTTPNEVRSPVVQVSGTCINSN